MNSIETQNGLTVRRYSVLFAVMIFAAVFMPTKFFWLPPVGLFVLFITSRSWKWRFPLPGLQLSNPLLALVVFAAYAIISSFWGEQEHLMLSLGKALLLCALALCGYLLVQNSKNLKMESFQRGGRVAVLFFLFGIGGYLILVFESVTYGFIYRSFWNYVAPILTDSEPKFLNIIEQNGHWTFNPQYMVYALLVFPMAMALKSKMTRGVLLGFVLVSTLLLSANEAAKVGLLVGIGIVAVLPRMPERLQSVALWGLLGAFIVMPFCIAMFSPAPQFILDLDNKIASLNAAPRFELYKAVIMDVVTQPWFGYGRDAARIDHSAFLFGRFAHYPHNFTLQIWLELGIFGLILLVWLLGVILHNIQKMPLQYRFYTLGGFFCALCPITFSYNLWSGWVVALFCITFWLFILFGHEAEKTSTLTE